MQYCQAAARSRRHRIQSPTGAFPSARMYSVLYDDDPTMRPDALHTIRGITSGARQDQTDEVTVEHPCRRLEQRIGG